MTNTKRIRIVVAALLVLVMSLALFACHKETQYVEERNYEKRYDNDKFYYVVGYPDDWSVMYGESGKELAELNVKNGNQEGYLCAKLFPSTEGDVGNVVYTIYKYDTKSMMNTINDITERLMNEDSDYYLNDVFVEEGRERASFVFTSPEYVKENPNHFQFNTAQYRFVRNGEDWRGKFYVSSSNSTWMFVICVEARETEWDASYEIFNKMMEDFTFRGYEASEDKK